MITIVIIAVIVVIILFVIAVYNGLIRLRNRVDEAWSDIEVQLKRRFNLIPNLVEAVKGYMAHEKSTFLKVTEARKLAVAAKSPAEAAKADGLLTDALKSLFAVAENYPELKANQNFLDLQRQLTDTEDKIQAARRFYNGNVRDFNTKLQVFPNNMIAGMFNFKPREFFEVEEEAEKETPKVKF